MSVLSITFHTVESELSNWEQYVDTELIELVENLYDVEKYILLKLKPKCLQKAKIPICFGFRERCQKTRIYRNRAL
jgi:hypothetical protein